MAMPNMEPLTAVKAGSQSICQVQSWHLGTWHLSDERILLKVQLDGLS